MRTLATAIVAAVFAALALASSVAADHVWNDLDCWQFWSWDEAQATYDHILWTDGSDWMHLDADFDGIACECLRYTYPCLTPTGP